MNTISLNWQADGLPVCVAIPMSGFVLSSYRERIQGGAVQIIRY
jgi:hypothetical protein